MRTKASLKRPAILTPIPRDDLRHMLRGTMAAGLTLVAFVLVVLSIAG